MWCCPRAWVVWRRDTPCVSSRWWVARWSGRARSHGEGGGNRAGSVVQRRRAWLYGIPVLVVQLSAYGCEAFATARVGKVPAA